jgi:hypothetical protein
MSTLGEVLSRLNDPAEIVALLAEAGDIAAIAGINNLAASSGENACELALDAVQTFTAKATDEAWVKLIGRIQNADSPAAACLSEMISWSIDR